MNDGPNPSWPSYLIGNAMPARSWKTKDIEWISQTRLTRCLTRGSMFIDLHVQMGVRFGI